jgi:hypothetical protein
MTAVVAVVVKPVVAAVENAVTVYTETEGQKQLRLAKERQAEVATVAEADKLNKELDEAGQKTKTEKDPAPAPASAPAPTPAPDPAPAPTPVPVPTLTSGAVAAAATVVAATQKKRPADSAAPAPEKLPTASTAPALALAPAGTAKSSTPKKPKPKKRKTGQPSSMTIPELGLGDEQQRLAPAPLPPVDPLYARSPQRVAKSPARANKAMQDGAHHYAEVKRHLDAGNEFELRIFANKPEAFQHRIVFSRETLGADIEWSVDGVSRGAFTAENKLGPVVGQLQKHGLLAMEMKSKAHPANITVWLNGENTGMCSGDGTKNKLTGETRYRFPAARAFWLPLAATGAGAGNNEKLG